MTLRRLLVLTFVLAGCTGAATVAPINQPAGNTAFPGTPAATVAVEDPADTPEPIDTPQPGPEQYAVGDVIQVTSDGEPWAEITITGVKQVKRYNGDYSDDVPRKGYIYIQLKVTYVAKADGVDYNPFDWQVFVAGEAVDDYAFVSYGPEPQLSSGTLPKGRKASGWLVYEVPVKGEVLFSYGGSFSNEAPIFEVVLRKT